MYVKEFFSIFNVSREVKKMNLYEIKGEEEVLIEEDVTLHFDHYYPGSNFNMRKAGIFGTVEDMDYDERIIVVKEMKGGKKRQFKLKKGDYVHSSMTKYVF